MNQLINHKGVCQTWKKTNSMNSVEFNFLKAVEFAL